MSLSVDVLARPFSLVVSAIDSVFNQSLHMIRIIGMSAELSRQLRGFRSTLERLADLQWTRVALRHPRPISRRVQYELLFDHLRNYQALLELLDADHLIFDIASGRADYREHLSHAVQEAFRPFSSMHHAAYCECMLCMSVAQEWS